MTRLRRIRRALSRLGRSALRESTLTSAAYVTGVVMVAVGVGMIDLAAGIIVGGLYLFGSALLFARSAPPGGEQ